MAHQALNLPDENSTSLEQFEAVTIYFRIPY